MSGAQVVWNLGSLSAGEERIVEMELIPTDEGELGSVATVSPLDGVHLDADAHRAIGTALAPLVLETLGES